MKYQIGDKVRIKSKEWYKKNKDEDDYIEGVWGFTSGMSAYCGEVATITQVVDDYYDIDIDNGKWHWQDFMFEEKILSETLVQDLASIISKHNLSVKIEERDGGIFVKPIEKEDDLPIDTPCMVCTKLEEDWHLRYYAGNKRVFCDGKKSDDRKLPIQWRYIIPFDKFNPNDIEGSLKHNIVK